MTDIAGRVYDHQWKIDPIVRSVLDTDFYKLLMAQTVHHTHRDTEVEFSLINRSAKVPLARLIDEGELREHLDHVRRLTLTRSEGAWLRGNTFYGRNWMFEPGFMDWLTDFRFPDYHLERRGDQYELTFAGTWMEAMMWEIPALAILMELRTRAVLRDMGKFELQVLYARAMTRVWEKIQRLQKLPDLAIADFGTRRRHGFLWQEWCAQAMIEGLGRSFSGTSNCLIAMRHDIEAIGTNAHELPMVYAALAGDDDDALRAAPYRVLEDWMEDYDGNLLIVLPDTFGSEAFFAQAPEWVADWTGVRIDSGDPARGAEAAIAFWRRHGRDVSRKRVIFSDGLDIDLIERLHARFSGRVNVSFGWGTLLTNDFRGLAPNDGLAPFSLVCKAVSAGGRPCVKLSDNPWKATGPEAELARYKRVFGVGEQAAVEAVV